MQGKSTHAAGHADGAKSFNRVEFIMALVHLACNMFIHSGEITDVSEVLAPPPRPANTPSQHPLNV